LGVSSRSLRILGSRPAEERDANPKHDSPLEPPVSPERHLCGGGERLKRRLLVEVVGIADRLPGDYLVRSTA